jgi:hypothetical protein
VGLAGVKRSDGYLKNIAIMIITTGIFMMAMILTGATDNKILSAKRASGCGGFFIIFALLNK